MQDKKGFPLEKELIAQVCYKIFFQGEVLKYRSLKWRDLFFVEKQCLPG